MVCNLFHWCANIFYYVYITLCPYTSKHIKLYYTIGIHIWYIYITVQTSLLWSTKHSSFQAVFPYKEHQYCMQQCVYSVWRHTHVLSLTSLHAPIVFMVVVWHDGVCPILAMLSGAPTLHTIMLASLPHAWWAQSILIPIYTRSWLVVRIVVLPHCVYGLHCCILAVIGHD